jgi:hypothetical protein
LPLELTNTAATGKAVVLVGTAATRGASLLEVVVTMDAEFQSVGLVALLLIGRGAREASVVVIDRDGRDEVGLNAVGRERHTIV